MRFVWIGLLGLLLAGLPGAARAIDLAGTVERLQGAATATAAATGFVRPLQPGSSVLVGDRIATTTNSRLRLRMTDGAVITLGDHSTMVVEVYDEDETTGRGLVGMLEGVFLATSGAIARQGDDRFSITTPTATLGVRGTTVWGQQDPDRLQVALLDGIAVVVVTPLGTVELTQIDSGVTVVAGQPLPEPRAWGAERLETARRTVAFDE